MTEALIVSNVLLWLVVIVLALVVFALTRQVGLLHERIAPVGALAVASGPAVGDPAPQLTLADLDGRPVRLGGSDLTGRRTLLFFLAPGCPVCESLLPTLRRVAAAERNRVRLVYASDGPREEQLAYRARHGLESAEYVLSHELGLRYEVAKLPFAVLIDASGTLRAKGLVNTREHLESLFEADRLDADSLQTYLARERAGEDLGTVAPGQREKGAA
ncbi:MAG: methylamine dehydrogenase accessory protein MauD [Spirochaetaceae bacterium]|nr:methylamine dehydrogenase accessory protein MauD [Myxococcales bacterium]MCB9725143.1 methylamine dehydrogenase accessory protein MauD [Spirochaetaceae bacterium]HPG26603.1 methylamine dehydrogenase accessory protein MauD [Myxococcota bacterium]